MSIERVIQYNRPFKFMLRNLLPNISGGSEMSKYLEGSYVLTNATPIELENKPFKTTLAYKADTASLLKNTLYLNTAPYSTANLDFKIEKRVTYNQIFDLQQKLAILNDPLINQMLMTKGTGMASAVTNLVGSAVESMGLEKTGENTYDTGGTNFFTAVGAKTLVDIGNVTATVAKGIGNASNNLANVVRGFSQNFADSSAANTNMFFMGNPKIKSIGTKGAAFTLASVFTPKIFHGVESPFPSITLTINHIAQKSIDEHIPVIIFLQKLVTPLIMAFPIYPVELYIVSSLNKQAIPAESSNILDYYNGIEPFTYTQQNVGYFNVTNLSITDLKLGYGTTDSKFYNNSGMPIPIGIEIKITMEAFDPFYYNSFDPGVVFATSNKEIKPITVTENGKEWSLVN